MIALSKADRRQLRVMVERLKRIGQRCDITEGTYDETRHMREYLNEALTICEFTKARIPAGLWGSIGYRVEVWCVRQVTLAGLWMVNYVERSRQDGDDY